MPPDCASYQSFLNSAVCPPSPGPTPAILVQLIQTSGALSCLALRVMLQNGHHVPRQLSMISPGF